MAEYMLRGEVAAAPAEEVIELRQIFAALRRHPRLILATTAVLTALATLWASREPQLYEATAVVQMSGARGLSAEVGVAVPVFGRESDPLLSKVELIAARGILGVVVDSLGLQLLPGPDLPIRLLAERHVQPTATPDSIHLEFSEREVRASSLTETARAPYGEPIELSGARFIITELPKVKQADLFVLTRETAIKMTRSGLGAARREGTDIVDISFTAEDPRFAQSVVNATVEIFRRQSLLSSQERSRIWRGFVAKQLAETDSLLEGAQARLSLFRSQRQVSSTSDRLAAEERQVIELDVRRDQLSSDLRIYRDLQGKLASPDQSERAEALSALASWPEISNNVVIGTLHRQRLQYERTLDSLTSGPWRITRDHPDAKRLLELVEETDRGLQSAVGSHIDALEARVGALSDLRSSTGTSIAALPAMEAEEIRLGRQVEVLTSMANRLREEYLEAQIAEEVELGDVEIVDLAWVGEAVPRGTRLKMILGLLAGVLLGGVGAVVLEVRNTSIRELYQLEQVLEAPGLGVIPKAPAISNGRGLQKLLPSGRTRALPGGSRFPTATPEWAEAFRFLRTNLLFAEVGVKPRSLAVTSMAPGEGKTTTATNLAATIAREGRKVLLVDCDLRRPKIHRIFDVPREPGMAELLASPPHEQGEDLESVPGVRPTSIANLYVMPSGPYRSDHSELFQEGRIERMLRDLNRLFDVVILDAPPLFAGADGTIVAGAADGVLLVARAAASDMAEARQAHDLLARARANVVGAVLNDPKGTLERDKAGYYGYAYAYGPEED